MPNNESTTKFKADISQLKSAMQQAQREVKLANAQFKAASSSMELTISAFGEVPIVHVTAIPSKQSIIGDK